MESLLKRDVVFIASGRFLRFPLIRGLAEELGAIFVSPGDMLSTRILDESFDAVSGGSLLGVMVEGRQMGITYGTVKRGAAYLAYKLSAKILPINVSKKGPWIKVVVGELMPAPLSLTSSAIAETMRGVCKQLDIPLGMAA